MRCLWHRQRAIICDLFSNTTKKKKICTGTVVNYYHDGLVMLNHYYYLLIKTPTSEENMYITYIQTYHR